MKKPSKIRIVIYLLFAAVIVFIGIMLVAGATKKERMEKKILSESSRKDILDEDNDADVSVNAYSTESDGNTDYSTEGTSSDEINTEGPLTREEMIKAYGNNAGVDYIPENPSYLTDAYTALLEFDASIYSKKITEIKKLHINGGQSNYIVFIVNDIPYIIAESEDIDGTFNYIYFSEDDESYEDISGAAEDISNQKEINEFLERINSGSFVDTKADQSETESVTSQSSENSEAAATDPSLFETFEAELDDRLAFCMDDNGNTDLSIYEIGNRAEFMYYASVYNAEQLNNPEHVYSYVVGRSDDGTKYEVTMTSDDGKVTKAYYIVDENGNYKFSN